MTNPSQALVGLAIIAKDEEKDLPTLLASISGAFDRVVLVDTGSFDMTKEVFDQWCFEELGRNDRLLVRNRRLPVV
jgi:hypothetical protein